MPIKRCEDVPSRSLLLPIPRSSSVSTLLIVNLLSYSHITPFNQMRCFSIKGTMLRISLLFVAILACSAYGFSSGEDKFIKKYAMMKIYESCFGPEVVKQIRKEMKAACAKCAIVEPPTTPTPTSTVRPTTQTPTEISPISDPENTIYANQQAFDAEKFHQAILAFRPNGYPPASYRPFAGAGYYQGFPGSPAMYYPPAYPQPAPFPGHPYAFPFNGQQFIGSTRMSRDMNIRDQLDALTSRMTGRVKNVTCVMQELGYLDENLEPNFEKITERITNLPIAEELKRDMHDGVEFCQQFSQCVPEVKRDRSPLSRELIRPMFFFKCYKHKKLEACIMKDVREKYNGVGEDDFDDDVPIRRSGKDMKLQDKEVDEMASSMYEFLYGSDSGIDFETVL